MSFNRGSIISMFDVREKWQITWQLCTVLKTKIFNKNSKVFTNFPPKFVSKTYFISIIIF